MTELIDPRLQYAETEELLPTAQFIDDDDIHYEVIRLSRRAPEYFWTRPGSYSGYHNGHEHGLWLHTLKLSVMIERLAPSYVERGELTELDVDRLHAAAILHDQRKNGEDPDSEDTASDHEDVMAEVVREHSALDETVARMIEAHMGPWGEGKTPGSRLEEVLHVADMLASDDHVDVAIPEPVPEALQPHVSESFEYDG